MSFKYGESGKVHEVIQSSFRWAWVIFGTMSLIAIPLSFAIPYVFEQFFPKYAQSSDVAIVALWAGVLYSVNAIFQLTITSIKAHKDLHQLIIMRFVFLAVGIGFSYLMHWDWLIVVSVSALMAETMNIFHGVLILRKKLKS
jgi:hypothetical protein